jgi:putative ABC transport system ATP-binding protein
MIELQRVCKSYHQGQENEVSALHDIDLSIARNKTTVLKGPSGSGKTTLLTLIGGLARPTSGRISLAGELISNLPEKFLAELRRKHFGFIFQRFNLIRGLSVLENVMLPAYPLGVSHKILIRQAFARLAQVHMEHKAHANSEVLSGGEAQRVAIARALINDPDIIIADEPTANLDTILSAQFLQTIADLRHQGKTVIMTSHDPRIWQAAVVDQVIAMKDGKLEHIQREKGNT